MEKFCYSPRPRDKYRLDIVKPKFLKHHCLGLGDADCVETDELWNLLAVTSKLLFKWENPKVKKKDKPASFPQLVEARADLKKKLQGITIESLIRSHDVYQFCDILLNEDLNHLELCKFFRGEVQLKQIIRARLTAYKVKKGVPTTAKHKAIMQMVMRQV